MGAYTQSIREIFQYHKTETEKLTNINDINAIAKRTLFVDAPIEVINPEHRDKFITGFSLHFFNDELGLETIPLWKIALAEKLYNNYDYINGVYDNLDKQLFAGYHVTKTETSSSGEETNNNITNTNTTDAGTVNRVLGGQDVTQTDVDTTDAGTVNRTLGGQDVTQTDVDTTDAGTVNRVLGGQDSVTGKDTNSATRARVGTSSTDDTIADEATHNTTGSTTSTGTSSSTTDSTSGDTTKNNSMDIRYDTPQGSLSNLRAPGGDATGQGVAYVNAQVYNYMSAANEHDESNVSNNTSHESTSGNTSDTTTNTINSTDKNDSTKNSETEYSETNNDSSETNRTSTTSYGQTNNETRNLTGSSNTTATTSYGQTNNETRNLTGSSDTTATTSYGQTNTETRNIAGTNATTSAGGKTNSNNTNTETTDYTLNYELLHKSESLLNQVWEIFDDLFMYIF